MIVNNVKNIIEEYVGEDSAGFNMYKTIYDPLVDNSGSLERAVFLIRREERQKFIKKLQALILENDY